MKIKSSISLPSVAKLWLRLNLLGVLVIIVSTSSAQITQTGAIDEQVAGTEGSLRIWAVPAEQKVRPEDRVEDYNLIWSNEENLIKIAGAGNEHVPFQVVVSAPVPENRGPAAEGFFIEASNFTTESDQMVPKEEIRFYLEHYIMLDAKSSQVGDTGYWPDALAPIKIPFNMEAQYSVVQNRPIWVDIAIPSGTPGGIYKGTITVSQHGKELQVLDVELKVYNFSLPDETPLITYMNISRNWLAGFYNQPDDSEKIEKLTQTYYEFIYANRMEPWFNDMLLPEIAISGDVVSLDFDDEKYQYYMNELNTKRVLLNVFPGSLSRQITDKPFTKEFNRKIQSYISQVYTYFEKNGWEDRLVLNSPIDEPRSLEDYEDTRQWASIVHEAADVPFLTTRTPVTPEREHPEWGTLRGHVDNFSIHGNHMNNPEVKRVIQEEQAKGGELTWYISCDQGYPQPNYFIDAPALDLVMVPWITARYGMDGILYWALNFWSQTPNPWLDAGTFHSGFLCSGGWVLNGEGSMLYPGDDTEQYTGQPDVDGPVSSIRFELLREGIEDYVYLSMLKNTGAEEFADDLVRSMVIDVSAFSRNLEELYQVREKMAAHLEGLNQ